MAKNRTFFQDGALQATMMLRELGNEHRLLVLCLLIEHRELNVSELLSHVDISQSALSQHLARLRAAGLIEARRDSQSLFYRISDPDVRKIITTLKQIYCP